MDAMTNESSSILTNTTRCERCGMVATVSYVGPEGATHFVCEHHLPQPAQHHDTGTGHDHADMSGMDKHAGHSTNMFRDRFWVSLVVTIPTVLYSTMFQERFGKLGAAAALAGHLVGRKF